MTRRPTLQEFVDHGALLLDLDGTLVDTAPDFVAVIHRLCASVGLVSPSHAAIYATVSSGARALTTLATELHPEDVGFSELNQALLDYYAEQIKNTAATLYPGMAQLLRRLDEKL
jgi:N-acetyl-D-muramate 6-phosphate phosphatase